MKTMSAILACSTCLEENVKPADIWKWRATTIHRGDGVYVSICPHIPGNIGLGIPSQVRE